LHVRGAANQEGFVELGDFFRDADDAFRAKHRGNLGGKFVDAMTAFVKRQGVVEIAVFL
jgi:hypothetical protein